MTTLHLGIQNMTAPSLRDNIRASLLAEMTDAEKEKQEYIWKCAEAEEEKRKFGAWPDPEASDDAREQWLNRVHHILWSFFEKSGIKQHTNVRDLVKDTKDILMIRRAFTKDAAIEEARVSLQLHKQHADASLKAFRKENEMAKKQEPLPAIDPQTETFATLETAVMNRMEAIRRNLDANHFGAETKMKWRKVTLEQFGAETIEKLVRMVTFDSEKYAAAYETTVRDDLKAMNNLPQVTQAQLDKEIADTAFPRCKTHNVPMDDDGTCPTCRLNDELSKSVSPDEPAPHWSKNDKERGDFWAKVNSWFNKYPSSRTMNSGFRHSYVHATLGFDSIAKTPLSKADAIALVQAAIASEFGPETSVSKPAETSTPIAPEKPKTEDVSQNAPQSNGEGSNLNDPKPSGVVTYENAGTPDKPISQKEKGYMTEAPFSANFRMLNQLGVEVQFTIRDEKVADGVDKLDKLIPLLMERGYTPSNGGRAHMPAPSPVSAPVATNGNGSASGDSGIAECVMIEVGTTYTGGKPALKFNCEGYENPLQYARQTGDMVKLLSQVKKMNGASFVADDLVIGKKYPGSWRVGWKDAMGKDEKMHRNVESVMPAHSPRSALSKTPSPASTCTWPCIPRWS